MRFVCSVGYYAYLTTGPPHKAGDRAVIVSPVQQRSLISQCLTFWYQMYGFPSVGQLNLYIISNGTRSTSPVFSVEGDHGSIWIQAAYTLPPPKASWQARMIFSIHTLLNSCCFFCGQLYL